MAKEEGTTENQTEDSPGSTTAEDKSGRNEGLKDDGLDDDNISDVASSLGNHNRLIMSNEDPFTILGENAEPSGSLGGSGSIPDDTPSIQVRCSTIGMVDDALTYDRVPCGQVVALH